MFTAYVITGIIAAILSYGFSFAYWEGEYPSTNEDDISDNKFFSFFISIYVLIFPFLLILILRLSKWGKYGLKYRFKKTS